MLGAWCQLRPGDGDEDGELDALGYDSGDGGACYAGGRNRSAAEDEKVVEDDVDGVAESVHPEDETGASDAGEEALHGHRGAGEEASGHDDGVVRLFAGDDGGGVSAPVADQVSDWDEQGENYPRCEGKE